MKRKLLFLFILLTIALGVAALSGCAEIQKAPAVKLERITTLPPPPPDPVATAKGDYDQAKSKTENLSKDLELARTDAEKKRLAFAAALKQRSEARRAKLAEIQAAADLDAKEAAILEGTATPAPAGEVTPVSPETHVIFTYTGDDYGTMDPATPMPAGWAITIKNSVLTLKIDGAVAFPPAKLAKGTKYSVNINGITPVK